MGAPHTGWSESREEHTSAAVPGTSTHSLPWPHTVLPSKASTNNLLQVPEHPWHCRAEGKTERKGRLRQGKERNTAWTEQIQEHN